MKFIHRHIVPVALILFGICALYFLNWMAQANQVGVNPWEFMLKAGGKFFYLGLAWISTHIIIKYFFTTIYAYTHKDDTGTSKFSRDWQDEDPSNEVKITNAIIAHVGIFIAVCLLFALAF